MEEKCKKPVSKSQKEAFKKYMNTTVAEYKMVLNKGTREDIKKAATEAGVSSNMYLRGIIMDEVERDEKKLHMSAADALV